MCQISRSDTLTGDIFIFQKILKGIATKDVIIKWVTVTSGLLWREHYVVTIIFWIIRRTIMEQVVCVTLLHIHVAMSNMPVCE